MLSIQKFSMKNLQRFSSSVSRLYSNLRASIPELKKPPGLKHETFGQPTPATHPHLLKGGEIVPCVRVDELQRRRINLMESIKNDARNSGATSHTVIIPSAVKKYISDKIPYVFRQNSDFFYLTGCLEPDSALVMTINEAGQVTSSMFMRPKDSNAELWDGPRTGVDKAPDFFGVEEAFNVQHFKTEIEKKIKNSQTCVWYDQFYSEQPQLTQTLGTVKYTNIMRPPASYIQYMRLFKSPAEIELMQKTCEIASEAINETMAESKPGFSEHHIFATVDYKCRMKNASHLAYPPVVAAGNNATTIHYINNTQMTKPTDLILMDAGCEYGGYTSDITRTWPIDGEFTQAQKILYDLVLTLQKELIDTLLRTGGETLDQLFETMCVRLGKYLQEVGVISNSVARGSSLARAAFMFCPHHVSHYLGMDVHDTPLISRSTPLLPGMVCTVEPGVYIAADRTDVPKEFRGIGIRIEDDVLIKSTDSVEVLTKNCIKERSSLENLLRSNSI